MTESASIDSKRWDALWINAHLATMTPGSPYGIVMDGALATRDGRIAWVGARDDLTQACIDPATRVHDAGGRWITPGLIDCHTHLVHAGNRAHEFELRLNGATYEDIAGSGGGIASDGTLTLVFRADGLVDLGHALAAGFGAVTVLPVYPKPDQPAVRILVRADSGFARDDLMAWCEANGVHFLFGLAQNERLVAMIACELAQAEAKSRRTGRPARYFKEFRWQTRRSWSRQRRVIAKAEFTGDEANPRFVVTSLTRAQCKPKYLYEKLYCARGEMENRIKECQLDLYADRTSTATMRANQLRLWFASMAYVLLCALRRIALHHTRFDNATCGTIRLKLLKIGALVRISVRRIKIAMASGCPTAAIWGAAAFRLNAAASARGSPT